jgi:hypothetical protein
MISAMLGFEQFGISTVMFGLAMAYSGAALYAWRKFSDRTGARDFLASRAPCI